MFHQPAYDLNENRLLWVDLETTGLKPEAHSIVEIAAVVTDNDLKEIGRLQAVVHQPESVLELASKWCQETHEKSGLFDEVRSSDTDLDQAELAVVALLEAHDALGSILCGSSIGFDRAFLGLHMPSLSKSLHYRNIDLRPLLEIQKRWYPEFSIEAAEPSIPHRAMPDILATLQTARSIKARIDDHLGSAEALATIAFIMFALPDKALVENPDADPEEWKLTLGAQPRQQILDLCVDVLRSLEVDPQEIFDQMKPEPIVKH